MNNLPASAKNDLNSPWDEPQEFECTECGAPMEKEGQCSKICVKASVL